MANVITQANVYRTRYQDHDKENNPDTFLGTGTTVQQSDYSHAFCMVREALSNRTKFANEYYLIVQKQLILQSSGQGDGSMTDGDEPEKWLVDSGASSHFSPFIHLFLNLIPCEPI